MQRYKVCTLKQSDNHSNLANGNEMDGNPTESTLQIIEADTFADSQFRFQDNNVTSNSENIDDPGYMAMVPELFSEHMLKPVNNSPQPILERTPDWFTIVIFATIAGIAYIRAVYPKIFRQLIRSAFNNTLASQIVREDNSRVQRASVSMSFIFYLTSALFLYQASIHFNWSVSWISTGFIRFLFFGLVIAFAYSVKLLVLKLIGWLFGADRPFSYYIFNIFLINNVLGLMLVPVVLTIAFLDYSFLLGIDNVDTNFVITQVEPRVLPILLPAGASQAVNNRRSTSDQPYGTRPQHLS